MPKVKEKKITFSDVKNLRKKDLNKLCDTHKIGQNLSKSAKTALLCKKLNISTCGLVNNNISLPRSVNHNLNSNQIEEFNTLGAELLESLNGWTKNIQDVPDIDDTRVKMYLLDTDTIPASATRQYKICRPYQLKDGINSINFNPLAQSTTFCALQGQCNSSQSTSGDDVKSVYVVLDNINGDIYGGYCTCTVG